MRGQIVICILIFVYVKCNSRDTLLAIFGQVAYRHCQQHARAPLNLFISFLKHPKSSHDWTPSLHVLLALPPFILPYLKFLQFDWLRAVVFQRNLKYVHVKITNLLRVVV